jgi:hypothetical protein
MHGPAYQPERMRGHDTAYRTRNFHTHPTHACIKDFCGFEGMRIASHSGHLPRTRTIPPIFAMADGIAAGAGR